MGSVSPLSYAAVLHYYRLILMSCHKPLELNDLRIGDGIGARKDMHPMTMNATMTTTCRVAIAVKARISLRILPNWPATKHNAIQAARYYECHQRSEPSDHWIRAEPCACIRNAWHVQVTNGAVGRDVPVIRHVNYGSRAHAYRP